jgi:signal transduction histidine kinase
VGDPSLLKQVYANLVGNALKYSRDRAAPKIEIFAEETSQGPRYFVKDDGIGFDVRQRERLFRVFSRLHDPEKFEGSGVGLAIVASIVQRHGGRVAADSGPEGGATFSFTLAAQEVPEDGTKEYTAPRVDGT